MLGRHAAKSSCHQRWGVATSPPPAAEGKLREGEGREREEMGWRGSYDDCLFEQHNCGPPLPHAGGSGDGSHRDGRNGLSEAVAVAPPPLSRLKETTRGQRAS
jgi:hypothetical protein